MIVRNISTKVVRITYKGKLYRLRANETMTLTTLDIAELFDVVEKIVAGVLDVDGEDDLGEFSFNDLVEQRIERTTINEPGSQFESIQLKSLHDDDS